VLWEQEAAGSNPAIPTSSEHMSILMRLGMGAKLGGPRTTVPCVADSKRRGYGEDSIYFDHAFDCRHGQHHRGC